MATTYLAGLDPILIFSIISSFWAWASIDFNFPSFFFLFTLVFYDFFLQHPWHFLNCRIFHLWIGDKTIWFKGWIQQQQVGKFVWKCLSLPVYIKFCLTAKNWKLWQVYVPFMRWFQNLRKDVLPQHVQPQWWLTLGARVKSLWFYLA